MGTMEVAGNRANIIVANPAGITCNGCGFLNADRATLTTGKPMVGPDGGIGFDVAGGKLRVEGAGLNGANLSRVDLMARTLEINAGIWADQLHVTAGAAKVDYATGAVSAGQGEGPAPTVALDTAALGGMYANSIAGRHRGWRGRERGRQPRRLDGQSGSERGGRRQDHAQRHDAGGA